MKTDTSEKGLKTLIMRHLTGADGFATGESGKLFKDGAQLFKQFQDNDSFRRWLTETIFGLTYEE